MGISVKSVSDLITGKIDPNDKCISDKYEFYIPDYQRGYRWGTTQATELLDDIYEFSLKTTDEFYCLQPLVVAYNESRNKYDVIDGQQRLTTLLILLKCLDLIKEDDKSYTIKYQTREGSEQFLRTILKLSFVKKDEITTQATTQERTDSVQTVYTLLETELSIVSLMKKEPEISQKTIADELGLNYNTVKYNVTKLKRMNVIEREGSSQKGHWLVKI